MIVASRLTRSESVRVSLTVNEFQTTGCSKMVDLILNTHILETTCWIIIKLHTFYVEGHKFYWLNLLRKVQIFVVSMTDFKKCSI